jgi:hypothetical protein
MWHELRHASYLSSSAKADDPVIAEGSVNYFTRAEYWVPRLRGA